MIASLSACGGGGELDAPRAGSPTDPPAPQIEGRLIVLCGHDYATQDLYDIRDGTIARRTTSPSGNGIGNLAARNGRIALNRVRDAIGHVEIGRLDAPTFDGRVIAPGMTPALDDDGTLAWSIVTEQRGRLADAVYVKRPGRPARRVAVYRNVWALQYIDGRLRAITSDRGRYEQIRGIGERAPKRTRLTTKKPGSSTWSHTGKLAYGNGRARSNELRFLSADGRRVARHITNWQAMAWSPDERSLLVSTAVRNPPEIGLMNPRTGAVRSLGSLPCGWMARARWLPG